MISGKKLKSKILKISKNASTNLGYGTFTNKINLNICKISNNWRNNAGFINSNTNANIARPLLAVFPADYISFVPD